MAKDERLDPEEMPAPYESPAEYIAEARELMHEIREALTKDADGKFPARYADMDWDGMNMWEIKTGWQDMDWGERYDLLVHALKETIWDLGRSDRRSLAFEFIRDDQRQRVPASRLEPFEALMTRMEAFHDEFAARTREQTALAERFSEFVDDAYEAITRLADPRPQASPDLTPAPAQAHPLTADSAGEDRGAPESTAMAAAQEVREPAHRILNTEPGSTIGQASSPRDFERMVAERVPVPPPAKDKNQEIEL